MQVEVGKIARYCGMSLDRLVTADNFLPEETVFEDVNTLEQVRLTEELNEEDRTMIFKMIETFLTKIKLKDFFDKNVAAL